MEPMLLLMRKELLYLLKNLKSTWIICLLFAVFFPILAPEIGFAAIGIIPYYLIYGVMAHEEKSGSEGTTLILPVTRTDVCKAKYALGILYSFLGTLGILVGLKTRYLLNPTQLVQMVNQNWGAVALSMLGVALLFIAVMIPMIFKFGTIKIRYIMFVFYLFIFTGVGILQNVLQQTGILDQMRTLLSNWFVPVLINILLYAGSYFLSVRIYEKKEF